jgi:hypothetical protein
MGGHHRSLQCAASHDRFPTAAVVGPGAQGLRSTDPWAPTLATPEQTLAIGENISQLRCGIVPPYGKSILTVAHLLWHRCQSDAVMRILMRIRKKQSGQ